jgi:hypothetical protein
VRLRQVLGGRVADQVQGEEPGPGGARRPLQRLEALQRNLEPILKITLGRNLRIRDTRIKSKFVYESYIFFNTNKSLSI